jgi:hypothetical protein
MTINYTTPARSARRQINAIVTNFRLAEKRLRLQCGFGPGHRNAWDVFNLASPWI